MKNLAALKDRVKEEHQEEITRKEQADRIKIKLEDFVAEWNAYAQQAKERGKKSLFMLMTFKEPEMVGDNTFRIVVATKTLKETFAAEKIYIFDKLAKTLGTSNFEVVVDVEELPDSEKAKFLSTPKEKYEHMVKLNPELKNLMDDLGLDFNY